MSPYGWEERQAEDERQQRQQQRQAQTKHEPKIKKKVKNLFTCKIIRYEINSFELVRLREKLKLSVEQFAAIVGWSIPYQYKLESGKVKTVSKKTAHEICSAFSRCGCEIKEELN